MRFDQLEFRYPFRKYQALILQHLEPQLTAEGLRKFHLVAPPGSGKTIIGLELIRRLGEPAVVFAPTTTIQQQWREEVGMFVEDEALVTELTSTDPKALSSVNVFTYQLIASPGEADDMLKQVAREAWVEELVVEGHAADEEAARQRLEKLRANNPDAFSRDLAQRSVRAKRAALRGEERDVARFLHRNARRLIDDLIAAGVRTVVLDECHHLLDYWAVVIGELVARIAKPTVVGLTATLPSLEDGFHYENYTGLLGEVDYEVPTPAVVKEGDLAPYRDLAVFVQPTDAERRYLEDIQQAFDSTVRDVAAHPSFGDWLDRAGSTDGEPPATAWERVLREDVPMAVAALRGMRAIGRPAPTGLALPADAEGEPQLHDWLLLVERYGLDRLKPSADREDHERLADLRRALRPFGFTLTERGLRHGRSPGDLVLAYSEAKVEAAAQILASESAALGDRLRAVVVTDFEKSGITRRVQALHPEAGSARHVFLSLVSHGDAGGLDPVLVTGRTLWIDADHGDELLALFNETLERRGVMTRCVAKPGPTDPVLEVQGEGGPWGPSQYVGMVTEAFERGDVRCIVGTRALLGEGWDALSLNTLIDLSSATTSSSVQQLRGRSIRKDPSWPRKVAHNWDVACVSKSFERGDRDLARLSERHDRVWGVIPRSKAVPREHHGRVVKGLLHVDPELAGELLQKPFKKVSFGAATRRMLGEIGDREGSYDLWRVGDEYSNFSYRATRLSTRDLKIRTVFTIQETLKRMLAAFRTGLIAAAITGLWLGIQAATEITTPVPALGVILACVVGVVIAMNAVAAWKIGRTILREQPLDAILLDVGRAVLTSLRDAGLVSRNLQPDFVRVVEQPDLSYEVLLDYASPDDAQVFVESYREVFAPVSDQRYLIKRDDRRLPSLWLAPLWALLRRIFRPRGGYPPAYHPVPSVLAAKRERADEFARHWNSFVGRGELVYTKREEGWRVLVEARAQRRPKVKSLAFELWR
ncbi:MAG TPA: DEAD/DEAH box helicase family protein [Actinomycetota bacterium]|nr:DEAD/DEAH box helicase family protein [Actinomycetota bacterium]